MQSRKLIRTKMAVFVYETKEINEVNPLSFITQNQAKHLTDSPLNLVTLAKHVQQEAVKKYRISPPMVKMDLIISFNGGPEQPFFSKDLDLTRIDPKEPIQSWLLPVKQE
jgi:hypothetical protein